MAINSQKYLFNERQIQNYAPDNRGVYGLYDAKGNTIYFGRADGTTIKSRLLSHIRGNEGRCTMQAHSFNFEITAQPTSRERQLLQEYQRNNLILPLCNDRIG